METVEKKPMSSKPNREPVQDAEHSTVRSFDELK